VGGCLKLEIPSVKFISHKFVCGCVWGTLELLQFLLPISNFAEKRIEQHPPPFVYTLVKPAWKPGRGHDKVSPTGSRKTTIILTMIINVTNGFI
jgi:hypothetical protein